MSFEPRRSGTLPRRWISGRYGPRSKFEHNPGEAACSIAEISTKAVVFLDVYHALEHLGEFCRLFSRPAPIRTCYTVAAVSFSTFQTRSTCSYSVEVCPTLRRRVYLLPSFVCVR